MLHSESDVHVWEDDVFHLGESFLESLVNELDKADFAILVLTADDMATVRNKTTPIPRDNVLFELGLFMGRLGRERSYFVYDRNSNIKIPSDLLGINGAAYKADQSTTLKASLKPACDKIKSAIEKIGSRNIIPPLHIGVYNKRLAFCNRITGCWWERIKADNLALISFINIEHDDGEMMLTLNGQSFDKDGLPIAYWESESSSVHFNELKIFYNWKGWFSSNAKAAFEGVGEISFDKAAGMLIRGKGIFSNINIADVKSVEMSAFELRRGSNEEKLIMNGDDGEMIVRLVKEKISRIF